MHVVRPRIWGTGPTSIRKIRVNWSQPKTIKGCIFLHGEAEDKGVQRNVRKCPTFLLLFGLVTGGVRIRVTYSPSPEQEIFVPSRNKIKE